MLTMLDEVGKDEDDVAITKVRVRRMLAMSTPSLHCGARRPLTAELQYHMADKPLPHAAHQLL